jgi:protease II
VFKHIQKQRAIKRRCAEGQGGRRRLDKTTFVQPASFFQLAHIYVSSDHSITLEAEATYGETGTASNIENGRAGTAYFTEKKSLNEFSPRHKPEMPFFQASDE